VPPITGTIVVIEWKRSLAAIFAMLCSQIQHSVIVGFYENNDPNLHVHLQVDCCCWYPCFCCVPVHPEHGFLILKTVRIPWQEQSSDVLFLYDELSLRVLREPGEM
jgi:hypothetical protein